MQIFSLASFGGLCALIVGILYICVGIIYFFDPVRNSTNARTLMRLLAQNARPRLLLYSVMATIGVFALGVVAAVTHIVSSQAEGLVQWAMTLAYIGFAASTIETLRSIQILPLMVKDHEAVEEPGKTAISRSASLIALDPQGWLTYGGVGLWLFVVNLIALVHGYWFAPLCLLGFVCAVMYWLILIGELFHTYGVFKLVAGAGALILGPVWYIWIGLFLLHVV